MGKKLNGIYQYTDLKTGEVVYIGKDSNLDNNECRAKTHMRPSHYDSQPFNRALQNNPNRYKHKIIYAGAFDNDVLNTLEINTIAEFKRLHNGERPKFNFTDGGDGSIGYKHPKEIKDKIRENHAKYWEGKERSQETRDKISKKLKGQKFSKERIEKLAKARMKNYARIIKSGTRRGQQLYAIMYKGKKIRRSAYKKNLIDFFNENYPNETIIKRIEALENKSDEDVLSKFR